MLRCVLGILLNNTPGSFSVSVTTSLFIQHVFIEYPLRVRHIQLCSDENACVLSPCPREVCSLAGDTALKEINTQILF